MLTETVRIRCPNCGELIEIVIDGSIEQQNYVEDCSVCCRPIELSVTVDEQVSVIAKRDDE